MSRSAGGAATPPKIVIVTPPVAASDIDLDLVNLTEYIAKWTGEEYVGGVLGGRYGYGTEYENDVFAMFPFYWGDCECGFEERSAAFWDTNPHAPGCFSTAYDEEAARVRALKMSFDAEHEALIAWAKAHGYAEAPFGMAVYCDCGARERGQAWHETNDHAESCPTIRPNFLHKPSGLRIDWYKWIGRDMEFSREPSPDEWRAIFDECVASVGAASATPSKPSSETTSPTAGTDQQ